MVPGAPASTALREQLETQILGPHPTPAGSETLKVGPATSDSDARSHLKSSGLGYSSYTASVGQHMHSWRREILLRD